MDLISRHYAASREWKRGEEESKKARSLPVEDNVLRVHEDNVLRVHVEVFVSTAYFYMGSDGLTST